MADGRAMRGLPPRCDEETGRPSTVGKQVDSEERDAIEILVQDHREVEQMFTELESLRGATDESDRARRRDLVDRVTIELVRHAVAEETQLYPAVEKKVSEAEAERAKREHAEAEETMKRLERLEPDDAAFDEELAMLMREIREHVDEEEGVMFVHMRDVFTQEELIELGGKVDSVKKFAPTRPHPSIPNEPGIREGRRPGRQPVRPDARRGLGPRHRGLSALRDAPRSRNSSPSIFTRGRNYRSAERLQTLGQTPNRPSQVRGGRGTHRRPKGRHGANRRL